MFELVQPEGADGRGVKGRKNAGDGADPARITDDGSAVNEIAVREVEEQILPPDFGFDPANIAHHFDDVQLRVRLQQQVNGINRCLVILLVDCTVDGEFKIARRQIGFDFEHDSLLSLKALC